MTPLYTYQDFASSLSSQYIYSAVDLATPRNSPVLNTTLPLVFPISFNGITKWIIFDSWFSLISSFLTWPHMEPVNKSGSLLKSYSESDFSHCLPAIFILLYFIWNNKEASWLSAFSLIFFSPFLKWQVAASDLLQMLSEYSIPLPKTLNACYHT